MEDLLGYSRDEFLGKELWELGLLQDSRANQEAFVELQKKGHIRYNDLPLQTKHGERRDIEFISNVCSAAEPKRRLPNLSTQNMAPLTSGIGYSITPLPIFPDRPAMENRVRFSDPFSFVSAGLMLPGVQPESGNAPFITTQFDVFVTWPNPVE